MDYRLEHVIAHGALSCFALGTGHALAGKALLSIPGHRASVAFG